MGEYTTVKHLCPLLPLADLPDHDPETRGRASILGESHLGFWWLPLFGTGVFLQSKPTDASQMCVTSPSLWHFKLKPPFSWISAFASERNMRRVLLITSLLGLLAVAPRLLRAVETAASDKASSTARLQQLDVDIEYHHNGNIKSVQFRGERLSDDDLACLTGLPQLEQLVICQPVTNRGFRIIKGLRSLRWLVLSGNVAARRFRMRSAVNESPRSEPG